MWCFSKTTSVKFRWLAWSVPVFLLWLHSVLVNLLNYSVQVKLACLASRLVPHFWPVWKQESNSDLSVLISIFFLEFSVILRILWCFKEHCQGTRGNFLKLCLLLQARNLCNTLLGYFAEYVHARKEQRHWIFFCHYFMHSWLWF